MNWERPDAGSVDRETLGNLVEAVAARRDRAAFERLFDYFAPRLKGYLLRQNVTSHEADELVQEAMLSVWQRAAGYDRRLASVATWVFTIVRNKRIDSLRRGKRAVLDPSDPALQPAAVPAADQRVEAVEAEARLMKAIEDLPFEQRDLLELAFFHDVSHREIAVTRGLPLGTVKSRLRLALGRLKRACEETAPDHGGGPP